MNPIEQGIDPTTGKPLPTDADVTDALNKLAQQIEKPETSKVDRFEVIDETGRAYVKGSIYGTPVKVELSYQDDGRTLKVFINAIKGEK